MKSHPALHPDVLWQLAQEAVELAAGREQLSGPEKRRFAIRQVIKKLDELIDLPQPWETISDIGLSLGGIIIGAIIEAAVKHRKEKFAAVAADATPVAVEAPADPAPAPDAPEAKKGRVVRRG